MPSPSRLIALVPDTESGWSLLGPHPVGPPYPKVLDSEGNHSMSWSIVKPGKVLTVEFNLHRITDDNKTIPFKKTSMRAEPTFSQFLRVFESISRKSPPASDSPEDIAEFLRRPNPQLDRAEADMKTESAFLYEVLLPWFKDDKAFKRLVGGLYMTISSEVSLSMYGEGPEEPGL